MNIWAGCNIDRDGWDVQPWASHPELYKRSVAETVELVARDISERPLAFVWMMLRKPARMLDSPWNDFQISFWGVPFYVQRALHQLILLLAVLGSAKALERGLQEKNRAGLVPAVILTLVVAYHFVNCLFISMNRYFITAIPAVLVLAGYGLWVTCI